MKILETKTVRTKKKHRQIHNYSKRVLNSSLNTDRAIDQKWRDRWSNPANCLDLTVFMDHNILQMQTTFFPSACGMFMKRDTSETMKQVSINVKGLKLYIQYVFGYNDIKSDINNEHFQIPFFTKRSQGSLNKWLIPD